MTTTETTTATAAELVAEIRAVEQAATPGPWRWRGNMDNQDPYLAGGYCRDPQTGKLTGLPQDVLGHIRHEITRDEARRHVSTDFLPEPEVDLLPRETYNQRYNAAREAQIEREIDAIVTDRFGEPVTEERLAFCSDNLYTEARDLVVYEVAPAATSRDDHRVYRADITGIRHANAIFIERSRTDLARCLAALERVLELVDDDDQVVREDIRQAIAWGLSS